MCVVCVSAHAHTLLLSRRLKSHQSIIVVLFGIDKRVETQRCKKPPSVHFGTNFWPTWEATSTFPSARKLYAQVFPNDFETITRPPVSFLRLLPLQHSYFLFFVFFFLLSVWFIQLFYSICFFVGYFFSPLLYFVYLYLDVSIHLGRTPVTGIPCRRQ